MTDSFALIKKFGFSLLLTVFSTHALAGHHILKVKRGFDILERDAQSKGTDVAPKLLYYGGPVIANAKVYVILWGADVDAVTRAKIGNYYRAISKSTYLDWLKQYNTDIPAVDGRAGTHQKIGRGTYAGTIQIEPQLATGSISDNDIHSELERQITAGILPSPSKDTLYMIYFPPSIDITTGDGSKSCSSFCAYHGGFHSNGIGDIFYGAMPDVGANGCELGCGASPNAFNNLTMISSHELIEAITDPFPVPGDKPAFPSAWNTVDGQEIGDLCAQNVGVLVTKNRSYFNIQEGFDNSTLSCKKGMYFSAVQ